VVLPAIFGSLIIAVVLWEAFETIILPRRVMRRLRLTVLIYRSTWIPWRTLAAWIFNKRRRETFLSYYGPLSLLILFAVWAAGIILGFALLDYSAAFAGGNLRSFATSLYFSGTTMFTLGLGDVVPRTSIGRILAVVESGLGFAFLALVLSYLPVIYQSFSRREVNIVLLDARAGSPPTAAELLRRHSGPHGVEALERLLRDWERSSGEILESHVSYPVLGYFRSQHNNESWLAALAAILDTTAILIANVEKDPLRQARLTFAMCRHTVVDLAQVFHIAPRRGHSERLSSGDHDQLRGWLDKAGFELRDRGAASTKLGEIRQMYEPYLHALSQFLAMELPPWILAKEITDNWRTSAWGRISGFAAAARAEADDHSE
jgi:ion channel